MITAMYVDDSEFMRELLQAIVLDYNQSIKTAGEADNGKTGLEKYKELKPDIVFMDIMMDEMDGIEALKQILAFDPNARVVTVSSMGKQDPYVNEALAAGAKAVICKPYNKQEVSEVLKKLLML